MELYISKAAVRKLKKQLNFDNKILLSLDDGVGPFSKVGICSLEISFDIIEVGEDTVTPDYDQQLNTNLGIWWYKGYSKNYLDENLKLILKGNQLVLSGNSGIIDSNVQLEKLVNVSAEI